MTDKEKEQLSGLYDLVGAIQSSVKAGLPVPDSAFNAMQGTLWCLLGCPEGEKYGGDPARLQEAVEALL